MNIQAFPGLTSELEGTGLISFQFLVPDRYQSIWKGIGLNVDRSLRINLLFEPLILPSVVDDVYGFADGTRTRNP